MVTGNGEYSVTVTTFAIYIESVTRVKCLYYVIRRARIIHAECDAACSEVFEAQADIRQMKAWHIIINIQ